MNKYRLLKQYETPCTKIYAGVEKTIPEWYKVFPDMWGEDFAIKKDWFEKVEDNCVFDSKRINDRMQELKEQEEAFNAARKGLKNTVADERTFHGEYYKDFNDYQVKKFTKELNSFQLKYFHKPAGTYYKKEIWQGIANNVSDLLKRGTSNEEIGEYLKTQFEILGK